MIVIDETASLRPPFTARLVVIEEPIEVLHAFAQGLGLLLDSFDERIQAYMLTHPAHQVARKRKTGLRIWDKGKPRLYRRGILPEWWADHARPRPQPDPFPVTQEHRMAVRELRASVQTWLEQANAWTEECNRSREYVYAAGPLLLPAVCASTIAEQRREERRFIKEIAVRWYQSGWAETLNKQIALPCAMEAA